LNAVSLALTIFALVMGLVAVALVAVLPAFLGNLGLGSGLQWTLSLLRWPILFVLGLIILGVFYRFGPDRDAPRLSWVTPGAVAGTLLWIVGSIAFSIYVNNFGSYNETYGALAAVVILMLWFSLSAFVALLGAEINAESERQTRRDTTQGQPKPMGSRGAYSADTVAKRGR
jgi:membrane protein